MAIEKKRQGGLRGTGRECRRLVAIVVALAAGAAWGVPGLGQSGSPRGGTRYYSTAEAPRNYVGPQPVQLALNAADDASRAGDAPGDRPLPPAAPAPAPMTAPLSAAPAPVPLAPAAASPLPAAAPAVQPLANSTAAAGAAAANARLAIAASPSIRPPAGAKPADPSLAPAQNATPEPDPIAMARKAVADCQARYQDVHDYVCVFHKKERVNGRLTYHKMTMKARSNPHSVYFKFHQPNRGREAIYIAGRNGGKVVAHDVGIGKVLAGTMHLDPRGSMAMEDNRHPVTEAGIGLLIDTVVKRWAIELSPEDSVITFTPNVRVGQHPCTVIESAHPRRKPGFLFYTVKLYIDHEHGLPIRFEAYDWPKHAGAAPELVEEYTYMDLRTNVGLRDIDFDPSNRQYSFGRF
jgi:hypothetical protein